MTLNSLTAQEKHDDSINISGKTQDTLNWSVADIEAVLGAPFNDLLFGRRAFIDNITMPMACSYQL